jgi:hypothetical protein
VNANLTLLRIKSKKIKFINTEIKNLKGKENKLHNVISKNEIKNIHD